MSGITYPAKLGPYYKNQGDYLRDHLSQAINYLNPAQIDDAKKVAKRGLKHFRDCEKSFRNSLRDREIRLEAAQRLKLPLSPELQEIQAQHDLISKQFARIKQFERGFQIILKCRPPQM